MQILQRVRFCGRAPPRETKKEDSAAKPHRRDAASGDSVCFTSCSRHVHLSAGRGGGRGGGKEKGVVDDLDRGPGLDNATRNGPFRFQISLPPPPLLSPGFSGTTLSRISVDFRVRERFERIPTEIKVFAAAIGLPFLPFRKRGILRFLIILCSCH